MIIDIHTHGLAGFGSRSENPEDYLEMAAAMKSHGTDAFLPTLFPGPVDIMRAQLAAIKNAMEEQKKRSPLSSVGEGWERQDSAVILGANLEGPFVNPLKKGALGPVPVDRLQTVDWHQVDGIFQPPSIENLKRLIDGFEDVVKVITIAPELPGALELIEYCADAGIIVDMGHSDATFEQARAGAKAGAMGVTHLFNAMSGLHHRNPGLAAYALMDDELYVEIIADGVHVHPEMLRLALKMKPAGKILLVSDSLAQAKTPEHPEAAPLYLPAEAGRAATLAGGGLSLMECVERLTRLADAPPESAQRFASENPQRFLAGK